MAAETGADIELSVLGNKVGHVVIDIETEDENGNSEEKEKAGLEYVHVYLDTMYYLGVSSYQTPLARTTKGQGKLHRFLHWMQLVNFLIHIHVCRPLSHFWLLTIRTWKFLQNDRKRSFPPKFFPLPSLIFPTTSSFRSLNFALLP